MVWLGLLFGTLAMTVSLSKDKLAEIQLLVHHWSSKPTATLWDLRTILGKLLYISQVCPPARLFLNRIIDTLIQCPERGSFTLSPELCKDLAWFDRFLPTTDGTFIIHHDDMHLVELYIDACMSGCRALTADRTYHATFSPRVLWADPPISHLGPLNTALAIKMWAPQFAHQLLHLFCDSQAAVTIFQAGRGKDSFLQACARDICQECSQCDITLAVDHILGADLQETADALSRYHLGPTYMDRVSSLLTYRSISLAPASSSSSVHLI